MASDPADLVNVRGTSLVFTKDKCPNVPVEISRDLKKTHVLCLSDMSDLTLIPLPVEAYWTFYFEEATR